MLRLTSLFLIILFCFLIIQVNANEKWAREYHLQNYPEPGGIVWVENENTGIAVRAHSDEGTGLHALSYGDGWALNAKGKSYFDGNVGIGIDSPIHPLHIFASTDVEGLFIESETEDAFIKLDSGTGVNDHPMVQFLRGGESEAAIYVHDAQDAFYVRADGDNDLILYTYTGNVGIGTTNPEGLLTVKLKSEDANGLLLDSSYGTPHSTRLFFRQEDGSANGIVRSEDLLIFTTGAILGTRTGDHRMTIRDSGSVGIGLDNPAGRFHVNGVGDEENESGPGDDLVITTSGDVGIGTTEPENKLHIDGAIRFDEIPEPITPGTGFVLYVDEVDGALKAKSSLGNVTVVATE
jgi:hypothetical protein